mmetsp:Transcript_25868/g.41617  ORF Transcript_25868/g.41617 Transcript_25868/m.41617 type:complete len:88 (-) Transcript_25868:2601-2864(-)
MRRVEWAPRQWRHYWQIRKKLPSVPTLGRSGSSSFRSNGVRGISFFRPKDVGYLAEWVRRKFGLERPADSPNRRLLKHMELSKHAYQ